MANTDDTFREIKAILDHRKEDDCVNEKFWKDHWIFIGILIAGSIVNSMERWQ